MTLRRVLGVVGSVLFVLPVVATWDASGVPVALKCLSAWMIVVTAFRPTWGLLTLAGLIPIATYIGAAVNTSVVDPSLPAASIGELMLAPFLLVAGVRAALGTPVANRLARPALVLGVIIAASAILLLGLDQQATSWPGDYVAGVWRSLSQTYIVERREFVPLHQAAAWIEGLVLAVLAERVVRRDRRAAAPLARMLLAGAAASGACACYRLAEVSLRTAHPLASALVLFRTLRSNPLYLDLNASGSLYALFLVPAVWLGLSERRGWTWLAVVPVFFGLWLSGSRTAQAAAVIGLALLWFWTQGMSRVLVAGSATVAIAAVLAIVLWNPGRTSQSSAMLSVDVRVQMMKVGLHIARANPLFGVGLGQFQEASKAFIKPDLIAVFPPAAVGENAHNNFIQLFAELGLVGLAAFLWLLGTATSVAKAVKDRTASPALTGFAGGLAAFLITCLAGHPLLTAEVLWLFLLVLGFTAGLVPLAPGTTVWPRWNAWLTGGMVALVAGSAPLRWEQLRRGADLDHIIIGATRVVGTVDGVNYHLAEPRSRWFVRASARVVELSLRATPESQPPCLVHVDVDGRPASDVETVPGAWAHLVFPFTPHANDAATHQIDLRVDGGACGLMVGTINLRD